MVAHQLNRLIDQLPSVLQASLAYRHRGFSSTSRLVFRLIVASICRVTLLFDAPYGFLSHNPNPRVTFFLMQFASRP
jgi:hypothetical protein